ncbi:MAG: hypothetical protein KDI32_04610, partial [Pseudomonadales bacterium]|nr:hypothetical protein [Pseudomonadales bacterium]
ATSHRFAVLPLAAVALALTSRHQYPTPNKRQAGRRASGIPDMTVQMLPCTTNFFILTYNGYSNRTIG